MAEFVTTTGISNSLESIITETKERLVIVTPYLKVNPLLKDLLEEKDRWKIDIRVIYGKSELNPQESSWLESLTSVRTSFCEDLHAKCYMNEATVLITSMNLYEFSQVNNREMGILVSRGGRPRPLPEDLRRGRTVASHKRGNPHYNRQGRGRGRTGNASPKAQHTDSGTTKNGCSRQPASPPRRKGPAIRAPRAVASAARQRWTWT